MKCVVIHHDDWDGVTSAAAVAKFLPYPITYVEAQYNRDLDLSCVDKDTVVFMVDFSLPREVLFDLKKECKHLVVLDHHEKSSADLEDIPWVHVDIEYNGACLLVYEYMHSLVSIGIAEADILRCLAIPVANIINSFPTVTFPKFLSYVADADRWVWELPKSKEVRAALDSFEMTPTNALSLFGSLDADFDVSWMAEMGAAIIRFKDNTIQSAVKHSVEVDVLGHKVQAANMPMRQLISDTGNALAKLGPFGITWFWDGKNFVYSLRSIGDFNVNDIAAKFGGGGHKNAAGFTSTKFVTQLQEV